MAGAKAHAQKARILERQTQALDLRRRGYAYRKIGDRLGVDAKTAFNDVQNALKALTEERNQEAAHFVQLELERLDLLLEGLNNFAAVGNPQSALAFLRVAESRRKLLGLDAPTKTVNYNVQLVGETVEALTKAGHDYAAVFEALIREAALEDASHSTDNSTPRA